MWQWASIRPGMIHLPAASTTLTVLRSSRCMSPGSAPTLLMRLPSITMASLRADGLPEPSISVPLRMTSVFLAALIAGLMGPPAKLLGLSKHTAAQQVAVLRLAHAFSLSPEGKGRGEGVRPRDQSPLTPTLSPLGRGGAYAQARSPKPRLSFLQDSGNSVPSPRQRAIAALSSP